MTLIKLIDPISAEKICRDITADLPEYFGIPEANERYAKGMLERVSFVATNSDDFVGLLTIEFPFPNNANIYWMAVKKKHQGKHIGSMLLNTAIEYCQNHHWNTLTVETLSPKEKDKNYLKTYQFYEGIGFKPLFELHAYGPDFLMIYMLKLL